VNEDINVAVWNRCSPWSRPKMDAPRGHSSISTRHDISLLRAHAVDRGLAHGISATSSSARWVAVRFSGPISRAQAIMMATATLSYRGTAVQEADTNRTAPVNGTEAANIRFNA
jgi:hypothetical protein